MVFSCLPYWHFKFFCGLKIPLFSPKGACQRLAPPRGYLIAFSGGQDSTILMVLWMNLNKLAALQAEGFTNACIWCNHLWKINDFYLLRHSFQISFIFHQSFFYSISFSKILSEQKARQYRHNTFLRISNYSNSDFVCTAHTQNDQIETFFINLFRGSGKFGLQSLRNSQVFVKPSALQTFY
uniref:tRNA(Ile)-lysidine/2-thiocytidine synthase N-terminal domain-containing protein n=1 Tax=Caulerpa cliftonii TaxID=1004391 RepID=A0A1C9JBL0_9CHLO|nr:hypothetical protein [Caulerpa cliftonii]AOP19234.1 hypothetical protein [Caulerpa cliftonii]